MKGLAGWRRPLQGLGKDRAVPWQENRFRNGRCHSLRACGPGAPSPSQHLAWVHEASGVQRGFELPHGLNAHHAHLLLQQLPLAQTDAMFPCARAMECQCSPGKQREEVLSRCPLLLPSALPHPASRFALT